MSPPSYLLPHPIPPLWAITEHLVELPASYNKSPLAVCFTYLFSKFVGSPGDHSEQLGPSGLHDMVQVGPHGPEGVCHPCVAGGVQSCFSLELWGVVPHTTDFVMGS